MEYINGRPDTGAGEEIGPELARAYVPQPRDPGRRQLVRVPPIPAAVEMPELRTASAELDRVRAALAATSSAVSEAQARRNGAQLEDQARAAAAFRSGEAVSGPSALAALDVETAGLAARQAAGRLAVAQCEMELGAVLDVNRDEYIRRADRALAADRDAAALALEAYADARTALLATLSIRAWLSGERKWSATLPELRGISSSDRPAPRTEDVLSALRRELDW